MGFQNQNIWWYLAEELTSLPGRDANCQVLNNEGQGLEAEDLGFRV